MKVAVVVDWLTVYAGAERVVEQIIEIFPEADLFSLVDFLGDSDRHFIKGKRAKTSFLQKMPWSKKKYRSYLPLMPIAIEQFDLGAYSLVISSSHAVAKGVITGPDQIHISYIHSPIRYAWDLQHQYLKETGLDVGIKSCIARLILHYIRGFDVRSSNGVDLFLSNSHFVARRVKKFYGKEAVVVYPPVDTKKFDLKCSKKEFYVTASRMVPYKKINIVVEAFSLMPDRTLYVIGDGPDLSKIKEICRSSPNVRILGHLPFEDMKCYMQEAKAFIFAAEEDFGIAPVEAMACGTPVIAYGKGGALETVKDGETGMFFYEQSADSIVRAVNTFENMPGFSPEACRIQAERFSQEDFRRKFNQAIGGLVSCVRPPVQASAAESVGSLEY